MSKLIVLSLACLSLVSCTFSKMDKGLADLKGKPIKTAVDVLGYPDSKSIFGDDTVYIWSNSSTQSYSTPQTSYTTGYVGDTPVFGQTTYNTSQTLHLSGTLKIASGKDGLIKNTEYSGNQGAFTGYARKLHKYSNSLEVE